MLSLIIEEFECYFNYYRRRVLIFPKIAKENGPFLKTVMK